MYEPATIHARLLCDVGEACELLGVKRTFLFALLASHQIPSVKIGRLRKIPYADLAAYVERLRAEQGGHDSLDQGDA